jgi:hypothetical protein
MLFYLMHRWSLGWFAIFITCFYCLNMDLKIFPLGFLVRMFNCTVRIDCLADCREMCFSTNMFCTRAEKTPK